MSTIDVKEQLLISVVMPVCNVQDYLAWSVRSVLDQSYPHFQLICVDDGSTDASGRLLDHIAATDERICAIHQANRGVSAARNTGIQHAEGEVVVFLDPDDALRPGALQTIAAAYGSSHFDVLVYGARPYPPFDASVWLSANLHPRAGRYAGFDPRLLFRESTHPFVWRTACRTAFLAQHRILFDEGVAFGEDQVFHFALFPHAAGTVLIPDELVEYRTKREGSLMATRFTDLVQRAHEHVVTLSRILDVWEANGWLQRWPDEMFEWSVDFLLPSLILTREDQSHGQIVEALARVWHRYFSDDLLTRQASCGPMGPVVQYVLEGKAASLGTLLRVRFALRRRAYGLPYALREAAERPWAIITRADQRRARRRAAWAAADAEALRSAQRSFGIDESLIC